MLASVAQADHLDRPAQADSLEAAASRQLMDYQVSPEYQVFLDSVFPALAALACLDLAEQETPEPAASPVRQASRDHSRESLDSAVRQASRAKGSVAFPVRQAHPEPLAHPASLEPAASLESELPGSLGIPVLQELLGQAVSLESERPVSLERLVPLESELPVSLESERLASLERVRSLASQERLASQEPRAYLELGHPVSLASAGRIPQPAKSTSFTTKPPT